MADHRLVSGPTSFFEVNATVPLVRRAFVESIGTCFLTIAMVGSGLAVREHMDTQSVAAGLTIALSIAGSLVGLIVCLGKISGGHYNPIITVGQWLRGERKLDCTLAYVGGQIVGAVFGAQIANTIFGQAAVRGLLILPSAGLAVSEIVASAGLMIVVFGCARSSKWETGPFAVGAWLTAAILSTPSASYANPAVTVAAVVAAGPVHLSSLTATVFVACQLIGLFIAMGVMWMAFSGEDAAPSIAPTAHRPESKGKSDAR